MGNEFALLGAAILAIIFLIVGIRFWQRGKYLLLHGKKARAIIFKNKYDTSDTDNGVYYPVVRFITEDKTWITQQLSIGYLPAKPEGSTLEVIYDPEEPTNVEIYGSFQLEFLPRIFVAIGVIVLVLGVLEYLEVISFISPKN